jgi:predicted esterase
VAQLVAPQWSQQQAKSIVWPTAKSTRPEVPFTTEQFVASVVGDVKAKASVNAKFVFSLSWSSGGPAAYAVSLVDNTPITGTFVAMSVFKPDLLPDLASAKGKPYYILHSPQDFIPMSFPEAARDRLAEHGGITTLQTYEGGHGWRGDVFTTIRTGVRWLEEQVAAIGEPELPRNPTGS